MPVRPAIIPALRYHDARAAIDFLCAAFGFTVHAVYANPADPNLIDHAELALDGQMVMLCSARATEFATAAPMRTVRECGANTVALYVVLDDVDGHAARARAAGADIFMAPANQGDGGRNYSVRDVEGYAWTFGNYDPFRSPSDAVI